jgi:hypothetical protein
MTRKRLGVDPYSIVKVPCRALPRPPCVHGFAQASSAGPIFTLVFLDHRQITQSGIAFFPALANNAATSGEASSAKDCGG